MLKDRRISLEKIEKMVVKPLNKSVNSEELMTKLKSMRFIHEKPKTSGVKIAELLNETQVMCFNRLFIKKNKSFKMC